MVLTNRCHKDDPGVVYFKRDPKVPESTNLYLAPGVELVGAATEKALGLYNATFLTDVRVTKTTVVLQDEEFPDAPEFGIPLSRAQALIRGRGAFAYQVAQARTLVGKIVLRQMPSPYMTETHIYVGLSRAEGLEFLRAAP